MTNGEKIKEIFPYLESDDTDLVWWNAEYKEPTTKNDLGVDAISRKEVFNQIFYSTDNNGDVVLGSALRERIAKLPSVTPIRPKGHWIKVGDRGFGYSDIVICKCSECEYQTEFVGKFDRHNLVIDSERADNYCSNCGADMREVVEE